ncbi:helix-turn-helix domain-containing protein [Morganella morganii]|uniref:helix-turn-helix domain-containing protein n=1 Tax=Morganella morganii TaxID=582 RepID=UPI0039059A41
MNNINFIVGRNIRMLRQSNGLTTRQLASILNVSQQQISRYERGDNKIDVNIAFKIVNFFDIRYEDIFPEKQKNAKVMLKELNIYVDPIAIP